MVHVGNDVITTQNNLLSELNAVEADVEKSIDQSGVRKLQPLSKISMLAKKGHEFPEADTPAEHREEADDEAWVHEYASLADMEKDMY